MNKQTFESKTVFKHFCEECQASYLGARDESCPGCKIREQKEQLDVETPKKLKRKEQKKDE